MRVKTRITALVLSFMMAAALFAGCGGKQQTAPSAQGSQDSKAPADNKAAPDNKAKEKVTIKVLKGKSAHEVDHNQMEVFKVMEEKTNVKVQWDNPPAENFTERYNLIMASGELPDVIIGMPTGDLLKYAQMGAVIPLNDLINKGAPNLKGWMEKRPEVKKAITSTDGKIYYFPMIDEISAGNNPLAVREDWLKKLNLQSPVTVEDWYNVWKAFKEKDPNGNGTADEIPFSGNGIGIARSLTAGWGVVDDFYSEPKDGGKIHYGPIESKYKDAITWIARMYKEGMIDKEIATNDEKAFQGKMGQNIVGSFRGALGGNIVAFNGTLPKQIPGFRVMGTAPLKGPGGEQIHTSLDQSPRNLIAAVITKANKNAEATVRWIDYMYSPEGSLLINMGIEGKHYTMQNGQPVFTDYVFKNPNGLSAKQACGTFSIGQSTGPYILIKAQPESLDDAAVKETKVKHIIPYIAESQKYVLPTLAFDPKDDEVRRQVMADIKTYVDESVTKFILGQEPLDNWNKYVEKVKSMGIDKAIQVYQKTFDEYKKK